ncbi:MAG: type II secretion system major pseudopilin GspG [Candidatus Krumholzibacteriia bacterium]
MDRTHRARRRADRRPHRAAGFTLIELLLVISIIGVLSALVVPRYARRAEQARIAAVKADITGNLAAALELYELDNGHFPTTAQGLRALLEMPGTPPLPANWNGPYLRGRSLNDPWGNEYGFESPTTVPGYDYRITSCGPDGVTGGDDDYSNVEDL